LGPFDHVVSLSSGFHSSAAPAGRPVRASDQVVSFSFTIGTPVFQSSGGNEPRTKSVWVPAV